MFPVLTDSRYVLITHISYPANSNHMYTLFQKKHNLLETKCSSRHYVRVSDPGATRKGDRWKFLLCFFCSLFSIFFVFNTCLVRKIPGWKHVTNVPFSDACVSASIFQHCEVFTMSSGNRSNSHSAHEPWRPCLTHVIMVIDFSKSMS